MRGQSVCPNDDVLNAVSVELGQQISEVLVHLYWCGSIGGIVESAPKPPPCAPLASIVTNHHLAAGHRRERRASQRLYGVLLATRQ